MSHKPWCAKPGGFKFFLYPLDATARAALSGTATLLFNALLQHPARTDDPAAACVLVPVVDTLCTYNMCSAADSALSLQLAALPHWNHGVDHVVFNFKDHEFKADVGHAVLVKSSFGPDVDTAALARHLNISEAPGFDRVRDAYDVVFPLTFYRCGFRYDRHLTWLHDDVDRVSNQPNNKPLVKAVQDRRVLVSFKGARHDLPSMHPAHARNLLPRIHNGDDVIIATYCSFVTVDCHTNNTSVMASSQDKAYLQQCRGHTAASRDLEYLPLLLESQFTIIMPGEGTHSYRLLEAMSAGSIPVLLGESAAPFRDVIDWDAVAVVQRDVSVAGIEALPERLRRISMSERWKMQQRCLEAFHTYLASMEAHLDTLMTVFRRRYDAAYDTDGQVEGRGGGRTCVPGDWQAAFHQSCTPAGAIVMAGGAARQRNDSVVGVDAAGGASSAAAVAAAADVGSVTWLGAHIASVREAGTSPAKRHSVAQLEAWVASAMDMAPDESVNDVLRRCVDVALAMMGLAQAHSDAGRHVRASRLTQSAMVWGGWVLSSWGYAPFEQRGVAWQSLVEQHALATAQAQGSWQALEPPRAERRHDHGVDAGTDPPPRASPSVGVVTVCAYDAAKTPLPKLSARVLTQYCRRHGYGLHFETRVLDESRPPAWSKVLALRKYLARYDWAMWMDCDSFFMDHRVAVTSVLDAALSAAEEPEDVDVVVSADGLMENTGVMLVRNSSWSAALLEAVYDASGGRMAEHPWWEQAALHHLLWDAAGSGSRRHHVQYVPQWWMNSYPKEVGSQLRDPRNTSVALHAVYEEGHFVVSFSGCGIVVGSAARCVELMEQYAAAAAATTVQP